MRTITAYVFLQLHVPLGWGHLANGRPAFGTFIISRSKCWHFDDRWPRIHGSLETIDLLVYVNAKFRRGLVPGPLCALFVERHNE